MWQWILNNVGIVGIILGILGIAISLIALIWSIWSYYHPKESSPWSMFIAFAAFFSTGSLVGWLARKKSSNTESVSADNRSTKSASIKSVPPGDLVRENSE